MHLRTVRRNCPARSRLVHRSLRQAFPMPARRGPTIWFPAIRDLRSVWPLATNWRSKALAEFVVSWLFHSTGRAQLPLWLYYWLTRQDGIRQRNVRLERVGFT